MLNKWEMVAGEERRRFVACKLDARTKGLDAAIRAEPEELEGFESVGVLVASLDEQRENLLDILSVCYPGDDLPEESPVIAAAAILDLLGLGGLSYRLVREQALNVSESIKNPWFDTALKRAESGRGKRLDQLWGRVLNVAAIYWRCGGGHAGVAANTLAGLIHDALWRLHRDGRLNQTGAPPSVRSICDHIKKQRPRRKVDKVDVVPNLSPKLVDMLAD
ncbi:hypothetical protein [Vibrio parahaemolyticus]|uniref:hypothetical protein n=4 Tax=Vibrio parahaemolyticus TaxID=670 RepID=UPI001299A262|nr:hypothetical protein [Vibrio parahaemolyticus]MCX8804786.1 hypothetical protein [Vibrio parahaemolyticus]MCX8824687.1 hypothetical protein [Vibrio parahaemolyticus]MCX8830119.1 hypothetical protein [Vibrio parahaemolyticus]MCX8835197.1 hypothetical protein [Vibrio parahaemolyticus]MCX8840096.1 hypothetical protein [Vibrio parahaemolyticus]